MMSTSCPALTLLLVQEGSWHRKLARRSTGCSISPHGQFGSEELLKRSSSSITLLIFHNTLCHAPFLASGYRFGFG